MMKRIFASAISLAMLLASLTACAENKESSIENESASKNTEESIVDEISDDTSTNESNDIVVLYTNDVHCAIDENIGYAGLAAYKKSVEEKTPYVSLVDCGDAMQGDFIGTISEGEYIVELMNELDYDFAVVGNHEFDYGMEQLSKLIGESDAQYLGCNISYTGSGTNALADVTPYEIVEYGDVQVAYIGVCTPENITKSRPVYFQENGEYVYSFMGEDDGQELYDCVQGYVDECRDAGADYVVVLSHLGDNAESAPFTSIDLVGATNGIDVVLDGHSHSTISCQVEKNCDGEDVLISSTGENLNNIGQLVITESGNISTGLISGYTQRDTEVSADIETMKADYETAVNEIVASSDIALSGYDENGIRLVRNRETTIGNFCADAYRIVTGADIAMINGGGIRDDLPAGDITYADMLAVHPFGNMICVAEVTGQQIVDCLEMACQFTESITSEGDQWIGENGGFQQVSGLKYTIDTSIESSVTLDENDAFSSVSGERRVKDVMVLQNDEYVPIDLNATYTLASHSYLIKQGGDGLNMFVEDPLLMDEGLLDYQVLVTYITDYLNGQLGDKYAETEGRITVE